MSPKGGLRTYIDKNFFHGITTLSFDHPNFIDIAGSIHFLIKILEYSHVYFEEFEALENLNETQLLTLVPFLTQLPYKTHGFDRGNGKEIFNSLRANPSKQIVNVCDKKPFCLFLVSEKDTYNGLKGNIPYFGVESKKLEEISDLKDKNKTDAFNELSKLKKFFKDISHDFRDIVIVDQYLFSDIKRDGINGFLDVISLLSKEGLKDVKNVYIISQFKCIENNKTVICTDEDDIKLKLDKFFQDIDKTIQNKITLIHLNIHPKIKLHDRFILTNKLYLTFCNSFYKKKIYSPFEVISTIILNKTLLERNLLNTRINQIKDILKNATIFPTDRDIEDLTFYHY